MSDTADSIASYVRFIADDQEISFLDTAVQLASINEGWSELQRRLALRGSPILEKTVVLAVPASTTVINSDTTQAVFLPDDFVMPYTLEERVSGSTDLFCPMDEKNWPPGSVPSQFLHYWAWQDNALNFLGATQPLEVRMTYVKFLPAFDAPNTPIPIPWAVSAIAYCVLVTVALARGAPDAYRDRCSAMAEQQLDQLTAIHVKRNQLQRRHRPAHYGSRRF